MSNIKRYNGSSWEAMTIDADKLNGWRISMEHDTFNTFIPVYGDNGRKVLTYILKSELVQQQMANYIPNMSTPNDFSNYEPSSIDGGLVACGTIDTSANNLTTTESFMTNVRTFIGGVYDVTDGCVNNVAIFGDVSPWFHVIKCQHRNGNSNGNNYGFMLSTSFFSNYGTSGSLRMVKECEGKIIDTRYFLDSVNWSDYVDLSSYAKVSDLDSKQDKLTFDTNPTSGSLNPVYSDAVYAALQNVDAVTLQGKSYSDIYNLISEKMDADIDANGALSAFSVSLNKSANYGIPYWSTGSVTLDGNKIPVYNISWYHISSATQTTSANSVTFTESRTYAVQKDSDNNLVVNVPWTDTTSSSTDTNYYPKRVYTSGVKISNYEGSSNCELYVPYTSYTSTSSGCLRYIGKSTSSSSKLKISTIASYGNGTYLIVPCRSKFGLYMYNSSDSEIGTYGSGNGSNPLTIRISSTSQTSETVYLNSTSFAVASFACVAVYKICSWYGS